MVVFQTRTCILSGKPDNPNSFFPDILHGQAPISSPLLYLYTTDYEPIRQTLSVSPGPCRGFSFVRPKRLAGVYHRSISLQKNPLSTNRVCDVEKPCRWFHRFLYQPPGWSVNPINILPAVWPGSHGQDFVCNFRIHELDRHL